MIKVFIIDDDPLYLTLLSTKLWQEGYTVRTAESVKEAIPMIKDEVPDAIVLDHNLQHDEKKGYQHLADLRKYAKNAGILYITSETCSTIINESLARGADKYLKKDNSLYTKISDAINEILAGKKDKRNSFWNRLFKFA